MAHRTTVHIGVLIDKVNALNLCSTVDKKMRAGWNTFLEGVLMDNNVYAGFGYYNAEQLRLAGNSNQLPGIIRNEDPTKNEYPDETRRQYYHHRRLPTNYSVIKRTN